MADPQIWSPLISGFGEVTKIVFGGVVAAVVTLVVNGRRQDRDRERTASAFAIRLLDHFERYAMACANVPPANAANDRRDPFDFNGVWGVPAFSGLPDSEDGWRSLDPSFATESLTFGTKVEAAIESCRVMGDHGDADDYEREADKQALTLGLQAWRLAARLRRRFKLPKAEPPWDIEGGMSRSLEQILVAERARYAANAEMLLTLSQRQTPAA